MPQPRRQVAATATRTLQLAHTVAVALQQISQITPAAAVRHLKHPTFYEVLLTLFLDLTFIFARGTTEVGTMGSVVGPPTASALQKLVGANGVSVQGVDYPADAAGNGKS